MTKWSGSNRILMSVVVSSVLGMSITPLFADSVYPAHAQRGENRDGCGCPYEMIALPEGVKVPELSLSLLRDQMTGFNLHLDLQDFELESAGYAVIDHDGVVHGHAHLFINGKKVKRLSGACEHLPAHHFIPGENEIKVTLNRYDHRTWSVDGKLLVATLKINTELDDPIISSESISQVLEKDEM